MTERPILFSAPMVRAILNGVKTQTRRILKGSTEFRGPYNPAYIEAHRNSPGWASICPHGQPGDRLWVRETWGSADNWLHDCETNPPRCVAYRADKAARNFDPPYDVDTSDWGAWERMKWRPSIHMPRWASRITLEIVAIRVERLQDISETDARAEGYPGDIIDGINYAVGAKNWFRSLWEQINGHDSWAANPWVWVIEFKRVNP